MSYGSLLSLSFKSYGFWQLFSAPLFCGLNRYYVHIQPVFKAKTVGNCLVSHKDVTVISFGKCLILFLRLSCYSLCGFGKHSI